MKKITKREMYEAIRDLAGSGALHMQDFNEEISDAAVVEFFENEIATLDKRAQKTKERAKEKSASTDELTNAVYDCLSEEDFEPIADIAARLDDENATIAKVTYRLGSLVKAGKAEKKEIEIAGSEGQKKRRVQGYKRIV